MNVHCDRHLKTCRMRAMVKDLRRGAADDAQAHNDNWWAEHMEEAIADGDAPDWDGDLVMTRS